VNAPEANLEAVLRHGRRKFLARWWKWILGVIILVAAALYMAGFFQRPAPQGYISEPVAEGLLETSVTAPGTLKPTNQVQVGSELSGRIDRILVEVNDRVSRGQGLAVINTDVINDQIAQARATLRSRQGAVSLAAATLREKQRSLARLQEIWRRTAGGVPSRAQLQDAESEVERAQAAMASARADAASFQAQLASHVTNRNRALIVSPISGVVLARQVEAGQTVAASFSTPTLFILAEDLASMQLQISVDEADVGRIRTGQKVSFTVDAYPGERFPASIRRIDLASNTAAGAAPGANPVVRYTAILDVNNADGRLRPGMTAMATINTGDGKSRLLVPNGALRFTLPGAGPAAPAPGLLGPQSFGLKADQQVKVGVGSRRTIHVLGATGTPEAVTVTTGDSDGRYTAVQSDRLKPGVKVITGMQAPAP
jgi:HlyD family secretion protein